MKMRFAKKLVGMVLAFMLFMSSAQAVQYVTFEEIPGDWNNYESTIRWMNAEYVPTSEHVWIDTDVLDGGEIAPGVFEFLADPAFAYENPNAFCAYLYIDTPGDVLYVNAFEGNWETKEYMLLNCIGTDGLYADVFFPSFDREGKLLATDRVYLYEYRVDNVWYYGCATLYFRYDGEDTRSFLPKEVQLASIKENEAEMEQAEDAVDLPDSEAEAEGEALPADESMNDPLAEQTEEAFEEVTEETTEVTTEETTEVTTEETTEEATEETTEEAIAADDEEPSIGIIGGSDGPTSVIVSAPTGFSGFFGNVLSGVLEDGFEETISIETTPADPADAEADEAEAEDEANDVHEDVTDEIIENEITETTVDDAEETTDSTEVSGGMLDFFSGVLGGIGK
ncbi:MAG: hypothetical protein IKJ65_04135 [Clostridia bacterium]|nr:hypothetical protein [Clostridia bacterium]